MVSKLHIGVTGSTNPHFSPEVAAIMQRYVMSVPRFKNEAVVYYPRSHWSLSDATRHFEHEHRPSDFHWAFKNECYIMWDGR